MQKLEAWQKTPAGAYLMQQEQHYFQREVADIFGFCALQFGFLTQNFLQHNRIRQHFFADRMVHHRADFYADAASLPLDGDCLDLLIFPHTLDFHPQYQAVLAEAARVLKDEGKLILTGFNPLSLWGLWRKWQASQAPWNAQFHPIASVQHGLREHHLQLISGRFLAYAPPFFNQKMFAKCQALEDAGDRWWPHAAAVYALTAVKRRVQLRALPLEFATLQTLPSGGQNLKPCAKNH